MRYTLCPPSSPRLSQHQPLFVSRSLSVSPSRRSIFETACVSVSMPKMKTNKKKKKNLCFCVSRNWMQRERKQNTFVSLISCTRSCRRGPFHMKRRKCAFYFYRRDFSFEPQSHAFLWVWFPENRQKHRMNTRCSFRCRSSDSILVHQYIILHTARERRLPWNIIIIKIILH